MIMKKIVVNILLIIIVIIFTFAIYYALLERFSIVVVPLFLVFIFLGVIVMSYSNKKENSTKKRFYFQFNDYLIMGKKIILYTLLFSFLSIAFIVICRIRLPNAVIDILFPSMLISAFFAQFILIKKVYVITKKIYSQMLVFLLCYINCIVIVALGLSVSVAISGYNSGNYMGSGLTIVTLIFFVLLLILIIKKNRDGRNNRKFVRLSIPILLFCFPTIKSFIIDDRFYCCGPPILKTGFDCIFPFGYSIISLFTKEYNICQEGFGYGSCYETRFNPEIFAQMFHNPWLMLHFISLILAIVFIIAFGKHLQKSYKNKTSNIC
jgi:hypothetical protein